MATALAFVSMSGSAAAVGDATHPYVLGTPIFTPKTSTSFTLLMTSYEDVSQSMLLRRYDAVGSLLTSQAITIGAHGSLQASPAAHSGAPLHVELWSPRPWVTARVSYTDSGDVSRSITEDQMMHAGPAQATAAGVDALSADVGALGSPIDSLVSGVSSLQTTLAGVDTKVAGVDTKVGVIDSKVVALDGKVGTPAPTDVSALTAKVDKLTSDLAKTRKSIRSLRALLKKALKKPRR